MGEKCIIDPTQDCFGLKAAGELERRVEVLEKKLEKDQDIQADFRRKYYADREERIRRDTEVKAQLKSVDEKLDKLVAWQEAQTAKPGKRWEAVAEKIILLVVGGVVAYLMAQAGL